MSETIRNLEVYQSNGTTAIETQILATESEITTINGTITTLTGTVNALPVVTVVATDPSSPTEGQVWYNTTGHVLKYFDGTTTQTVAVV